MKKNIVCPKCNSPLVSLVANAGGNTPMIQCSKCGYKNSLFPQIGSKQEDGDED